MISEQFIEKYKNIEPLFGGNGLGEFVYLRCVEINTPVLCSDLIWRKAGHLEKNQELIAFDEFPSEKRKKRQIQLANVTHNEVQKTKCLEITLEDGDKLICTPEHRWLVKVGTYDKLEWIRTDDLLKNRKGDFYLPLFEKPWKHDTSYEAGFLAAAFDSEGSLDKVTGISFVQVDNPLLEKVKEYLTLKNFKYSIKEKKNHKNSFGFKSNKKIYQISIYGREDVLRFLGTFRPPRLLKKFRENFIKLNEKNLTGMNGLKAKKWIKIVSIENIGDREVAVLSTTTKTHITAGYPSHNTYSRWLPDQNRREKWFETVRRVVDYSIGLYKDDKDHTSEAEELFDAIFNLKVFPAGRTLWVGGTQAVEKFPMANYNCSFRVVNDLEAFSEVFYLLMLGCGTGFRVLPEDVRKLPWLRSDVKLEFSTENYYTEKQEHTTTTLISTLIDSEMQIFVGDSKEGWVEALSDYFKLLASAKVTKIVINTHDIRPKGALLKTFGGRASGPEGLIQMFTDIHRVIQENPNKAWYNRDTDEEQISILRPIDALDIMNIIAWNVVVGGVRRSSQIALFAQNDKDILNAKLDLYVEGSPNFGKNWRAMSNNSIYFTSKPSKFELRDIFTRIKNNGEPGFVNSEAAALRRPNFNGINPCAEILLDNRGLCNLCEINVTAFVVDNGRGLKQIDYRAMEKAISLAVRMGLRITTVDLELPEWDKVQKRDRLIGISLSGIEDAKALMGHDFDLESLRSWANYYAQQYAKEMRILEPLLVTTIKPSGTISQLPTISSGVHKSYAPFYIRRVRITATDPLAHVMRDLGYPIFPEGVKEKEYNKLSFFEKEKLLNEASTWVVEFPVKTNTKQAASQEPALLQFNRYLDTQKRYTDHNTSITIYFKDEEVDILIDAISDHWDEYIAVSFLPTNNISYPLMPYEEIDAQEYYERAKSLEQDKIVGLLNEYEFVELQDDELDASCATGVCPPR